MDQRPHEALELEGCGAPLTAHGVKAAWPEQCSAMAAAASSSEAKEREPRPAEKASLKAQLQRCEQRAAAAEGRARKAKKTAARRAEAAEGRANAAEEEARAAASTLASMRQELAESRRCQLATEVKAFAAEARHAAAESEVRDCQKRAAEAEAAARTERLSAETRFENIVAELQTQVSSAEQAAAAALTEKEAAECRARSAEVVAAEAAAATVQRERQEAAHARIQFRMLRATLRGILDAGQCPILLGPWQDPVVASDGQTYDRARITPWLLLHGTSPMTRARLEPLLFPNRFAAEVLEQLTESGLDADDDASGSQLVEDDNDPEPGALLAAIERADEAVALQLVRRRRLPGLNDVDPTGTVLHGAIWRRLPKVALAILARQDFARVNAKTRWGSSALHFAAAQGMIRVCNAILSRPEFTELLAVDNNGITARDRARANGHSTVAAFLLAVEAP